jgi:hypothetical protein
MSDTQSSFRPSIPIDRLPQTVRACVWGRRALVTGLGVFGCGAVIWWMFPGDLLTRGGYSEDTRIWAGDNGGYLCADWTTRSR